MTPDVKTTVREATLADAPAIARVHVETWLDAYRGIVADAILDNVSVEERTKKWNDLLSRSGSSASLSLVADRAGAVVGFISGGENRKPAFPFDAELYALYVHPGFQRRHVGRELTRSLVEALRAQGFTSLLVGVLKANASARRFYETLGGVYAGEQPLVWGDHSYPEVFYGWKNLDEVPT